MKQLKNVIVDGPHGKAMGVDVFYMDDNSAKPIVIFSHGFKGFKDWGHFNLVAEAFAEAGFVFIKFNYSHNGTTIEQPADFADLEAFGQNNFSIELDDLGVIIDWVLGKPSLQNQMDKDKLYLMGHSRGGGLSILKAAEDSRVKKIVTWSAIYEIGRFWSPDILEKWKAEGVLYVPNSRTNQQMPMYYQYVVDCFANKDRLDIPAAAARLQIPALYIHGDGDPVVPVESAGKLQALTQGSKVLVTEISGHTFNTKHPWTETDLPSPADQIVATSMAFLKA